MTARKYYNHIMEYAPHCIFICNTNGNILEANKNSSHITGYKKNELLQMCIFDLVYPEDLSHAKDHIINAAGSGRSDSIVRFITRSDNIITLKASTLKCDDDTLLSFLEDITEQQNTSKKVEEREQMFRQVTENIEEIVWIKSADNKQVEYISPAFEDIFGIDSKILYNDPDYFFNAIAEEDRPEIMKKFSKGPANTPKFIATFRIKKPNGRTRHLFARFFPVINDKGEVLRNYAFIKDITKEIKAKLDLHKAQEVISDYSLALEVTNLELEDALSRAESASKAKSEFLSNMSHEIRTPLNGVVGYSELLRSTLLDDAQKQYVQNIIVSVNSLIDIINDILDFSKIESGNVELELIRTDILEIVENALSIVEYQAAQKDIELQLCLSPFVPRYAIADPVRLKQIIVNLLSNAVKFTNEGEVELGLSFKKIDNRSGKYSFYVRDSGIGISEEQRSKLFKAFSQADTSTTRKFGGTGLGLIISNLLAQKMGSNIDFVSEPKKGSKFFFSIDLNFEEGVHICPNHDFQNAKGLLIDDNEQSRKIIKNILAFWNVDIYDHDNVVSALNTHKELDKFDIVIIDHQMPYIDGLKTMNIIKENIGEIRSHQTFILLTSPILSHETKARAKEMGFASFLAKPLRPHQFLSALINRQTDKRDGEAQCLDMRLKCNFKPVILIAEDTNIGRKLAKTMIESIMPDTLILEAANGNEALNIAKTERPDLIFMDVQMPVMDGLEAARELRKYEKAEKHDKISTVIALSAGVFKEEREKCIKAGMNDFLPKPLVPKALREILSAYLLKNNRTVMNLNTDNHNEKNDTPLFDRDALLTRLGGNADIVSSLLKEAPGTLDSMISDLNAAIRSGQPDNIKSNAHKLKGTLMNLCFDRMAKKAEKLEKIAHNDMTGIDKLLTSLKADWRMLKKMI